jgi:ABC-2 type transport system permease protein
VLIASLCGYVALLGTMNQFGFDRGALWMDVAVGDVVRDELIGKNLGTCTAVGPLLAVVGVGLAAASGGWVYVPATWLLGAAGLGAGLGIANVVSVRFPVRLPESRSPFGGQGGGQGCTTSLIILGCTLVQNLAIAPVAIATLIAVRIAPASLVVVAPMCAAYGAAVWLVGLRIATATGRRRQPELLQAVDPAQSDR